MIYYANWHLTTLGISSSKAKQFLGVNGLEQSFNGDGLLDSVEAFLDILVDFSNFIKICGEFNCKSFKE